MRAHFLDYRLISCKSAFDMQPDGGLDELACFFLGLPLGIATLEGRTNGHKPAILVPLNHNSEFVILHRSTASKHIVLRLPYSDFRLLTPAFLLLPLHERDFLSRQAVQVIHQPVNLCVRRINLALNNGLLRRRFRGGKLLCYACAGMSWKNRLYFGDNLKILREYVPDASVDLIYLDPPFNSSATYNVLFKEKSGEESAAQITAFEDTWQWSKDAEAVYREIVESGPRKLADLMQALLAFLGRNKMMGYLMTLRLDLSRLVTSPVGKHSQVTYG